MSEQTINPFFAPIIKSVLYSLPYIIFREVRCCVGSVLKTLGTNGGMKHLEKTHFRTEQTEVARTLATVNLRSPVRKQRVDTWVLLGVGG